MTLIKLLAVGDIYLQSKKGNNPFEEVKGVFREKDILFGNLETVLSNKGKEVDKAVPLHTSPDKVKYLKDASFDVFNLANNHILDLGIEGFNETLEILSWNDIQFIGVNNQKFSNRYLIIEKKGLKIGFLGFCESGFRDYKNNIIINKIDEKTITNDIERIKEKCDVVIISLHWGFDNVLYPSPKQIELAHRIIKSGGNIILGHHSHVVQGIEEYKGGLIAYSLGNFQFFNSSIKKEEKRNDYSIVLSMSINKNGLMDYDLIPVKINENFTPYLISQYESKKVIDSILEISKPIVSKEISEARWFKEISEEYLLGNIKSWIFRIKKYGFKHFLEFCKWLVSPFVIRCYIGLLKQIIKRR
ncbi:MAG: CapA family protein [Parcubacteria group bacterium]|nr:CapA family protein [Parcubacteria group bacterium]